MDSGKINIIGKIMGSKYSRFKIFHFKDKLDSLERATKEILPPIHVRIKPTNVCNHNCWFCAYKSDELQLGQDMVERDSIPHEKMMNIIEDIKDMGVKAVTFSGGGEPFVYKHLKDAVKKLVEYNISFASLTNGSKLNGEIAELFASHGSWLRVSIDGYDDKSYAKARSVKLGEFSKIINNMKEFVSIPNRTCNLGISFVTGKDNYFKVYEFSKLMKEIGVDSIKISPCIVDNDREKNNIYHQEIFDAVKEQTKKAKEELEDENFEIYDSYHMMDEKFDKEYTWCPYSQVLPVIGADLNVYPCQDKAYNLDNGLVGSIKDKGFKEFWLNDKEKFFKINPSCHCSNHCVSNGKNKMILEYLDADKDHLGFV
jgi:MoaA/NifB/PqqE/SkfB family radical SAM enzyme